MEKLIDMLLWVLVGGIFSLIFLLRCKASLQVHLLFTSFILYSRVEVNL